MWTCSITWCFLLCSCHHLPFPKFLLLYCWMLVQTTQLQNHVWCRGAKHLFSSSSSSRTDSTVSTSRGKNPELNRSGVCPSSVAQKSAQLPHSTIGKDGKGWVVYLQCWNGEYLVSLYCYLSAVHLFVELLSVSHLWTFWQCPIYRPLAMSHLWTFRQSLICGPFGRASSVDVLAMPHLCNC